VHVLAVVLVEMQQEKLPNMYSQVMKAAQDNSGLVIDDVTIKINREEEEETYGRGK
jgi:F0F1-type ATP synthase gamma subunit